MSQSDATSSERRPGPSGLGGFWSFFRSRAALWVGLAIVVSVGLHFGLKWSQSGAPAKIAYSTFLDRVEAGLIERVEIVNGTQVKAAYTAKAVQAGEVSVPAADEEPLGVVGRASEWDLLTTKPESHELAAFLQRRNDAATEDGATITFRASEEEDWGRTLLLWGLPVGLILGIWFFFMRRLTGGSRRSEIGGNTATLFQNEEGTQVTFDDVAGLDEAKEEVAEVVDFLRTPEKFTRLGGTLPTGVLLVGPPGTGKTLMAKAAAGEAGVPFFSISGSDFMEMFVGVGASRVRDLFERAKEKAPCIIFIDEMDAIGRTRGQGRMGGGNDERDNTLNQLLVEMDGFDSDEGVVIMGATNRPDVLDSALLRPGRFDRQIAIHKPDRLDRAKIFQVHVQGLLLDDTVDLDLLARQTPGFAGAEIANVCNEAALLAARSGKEAVQMANFERAIDRVIAGLEKSNKLISPEEREVIAHHESGHAVVGWFLEHTDPVVKVSIVPRGVSALGYAQHLPEERDLYSKSALMDRMTMALGGRVAETIVFGQVTTGAKDDLRRVTNTAQAMVVEHGMSDRLGPLSYSASARGDDAPWMGKPYSDATAQAIDEEVRALVEEARSRAANVLREKRELLSSMAEALLENEVLEREALVELLGTPPHESGAAVQNRGVPSVGATAPTQEYVSSEDGTSDGSSSESDLRSNEPETPPKSGS